MMKIRSTNLKSTLAAVLGPEDVRPGQMVAVFNVIEEVPSFLWCQDSGSSTAGTMVSVRMRSPDSGIPLKVVTVCLPFVLLKDPQGNHRTEDLRGRELVRLDPEYARLVWKHLRKQRPIEL